MKKLFLTLFFVAWSVIMATGSTFNDGHIRYSPVKLTDAEKQIVANAINGYHKSYDPEGKMIVSKIRQWNYHTDATSADYHQVRASFNYAVALLDLDDPKYTQRAFDVIEKTISLQSTDLSQPWYGVWPYYEEEPLATKKSPVDYNWADFNVVSLLDIYMGHKDRIPAPLLKKIEDAIVLGAKAVRKRDMGPGYTNIAIMGTYVTYVSSHLFNMPDMQSYAKQRLKNFYEYTLDKGGFTEYNSPTYTIVALDELDRMRRHIVEPSSKAMIDSLYSIAWETVASHYHKPSAQWAGPHSRSYRTLIDNNFYGILKEASGGKIDLGVEPKRSDVKIKHQIPEYLLPYFTNPTYPRTEIDVFEKVNPQIVGTTYLTDTYAVGTSNRSSLWNQRRPLTVYWGSPKDTHYMQVRFLHDMYDFSSASFYSSQRDNSILAGINLVTNGGDKHISIDRMKDGKFKAKDLRIRFEFGNCPDVESLKIPKKINSRFDFVVNGLKFNMELFIAKFGPCKCYWEKGGDGKNSWIDLVIYSGNEANINVFNIDSVCFGFTMSVGNKRDRLSKEQPVYSITGSQLKASWNNLNLAFPVSLEPLPRNL